MNVAKNETQGEWALPDGWLWTTIGEVAETTSGGTPLRKHPEYYGGSIPWIKSGELEGEVIISSEEFITEEGLSSSSARIFPKGTPVVALYGATVGKTGILGLDAATNQAICAIFALHNAFTAKFITYWLKYRRSELIELSVGGAQPNISQRIIRAFPFPLAPLPEQHRIVAEIETQFTRLDAGVAALERAQVNLRRYKASVLKAACEGRLVPTEASLAHAEGRDYEPADQLLARILAERRARWEAEHPGKRYKGPVSPDTEDMPELPEGWEWATVEQIGKVRLGRQRSPKYHQGPNMRPYLRAANATWDGADLSDVKEMDFPPEIWDNYRLQKNDILLAEASGSPNEVGKPFIWREEIPECGFQNTLIRVRLFSLSPEFVYVHFLTDALTGRFGEVARGISIQHLGAARLSRFVIAFPPLPEQRRIVAEVERRLSVVAVLEASVVAALARARRLRQAVLKQAFEGRLVPQHLDDEPASVLLERIRAEREGK